MKTFGNIVTRYDDMLYDSRPSVFNEFITDKYNKVHNELYNDALTKYFNNIGNIYITANFLYEFFKTMENSSETYDMFFNKYTRLPHDNYLKQCMSKLSIDTYKFLKEVFEKSVEFLEILQVEITNSKNIEGGYALIDENNSFIQFVKDFRRIYLEDRIYLSQEDDSRQNDSNSFYNGIINSESPVVKFLFKSEFDAKLDSDDNEYVFILEDEHGTRIAYNKKGEWYLVLEDGDMFVSKEAAIYIIKLIDYINEELRKFIINLVISMYKDCHKIIEIKNDEYWQPSSIIALSNIRPYRKDVIDLTPYWNMNQGYEDIDATDIEMTKDKLNDVELIEINYINGMAKVRSRTNDIVYSVPFKYLNDRINVSEDMKLDNTFQNKYSKL